MSRTIRAVLLALSTLAGAAGLTPRGALAAEPADELAAFVLKSAGADQGLCLVIDAADGGLTAKLAKGSRMYVQGCTWNTEKLQTSRKALAAAGVAERASITSIEAAYLPYADNLVNLLVSASWGDRALEMDEVLRVMAPGGTALLGNDGNPAAVAGLAGKLKQAGVTDVKSLARKGWVQFVKPVDPGFDTWTHTLAGPDLSYVNNDTKASPWGEVRWIGDPRWGALYGTYSCQVTAGGRLYYKENRAASGSSPYGLQTWWVARDAYNGTELWRVPSGPVFAAVGASAGQVDSHDDTLTCDDRLVFAVEDRVVLRGGEAGRKIIARDGATGKKVREYAMGFVPRTVTSIDTVLLVSDKTRVVGLDKESGKVLWTRPATVHPPAADKVAYVLGTTELEAVELTTGASRWKTKVESDKGVPTSLCKASVVYVYYKPPWRPITLLTAYDAKKGNLLWKKEAPPGGYGLLPYPDELVLLDVDRGDKDNTIMVRVLDPRTGNSKREFRAKGNPMLKCYPTKGCANFLLYSSSWFLDIKSGETLGQMTVRSPCQLGQMPANGLTYFLPHHCDCQVTLRGLLAMSRPGSRQWLPNNAKEGSPRLFSSGAAPALAADKPDEWPMFRKDMVRSNSTPMKLPEQLQPLWTEQLGDTRLTQAVSAYGVLCVAEPLTHRVLARDAATGKELWSFVADGRVDFPPALHKGLCLFGTNGGSVYGLDARTGKEVWRLRAAPTEKYIAEEGQFASAWPVIGGVMPMNGEICFTCGRAGSVDGGMWLFAADAATGKVRWRTRGGSSGDMVLSDGKELYLTKSYYHISDGTRVLGAKTPSGILRTTNYLSPVAISDYMACVEPALSSQKHIELTDGLTTGESLAFNNKFGVAAWRYRFGVPTAMMKKNKQGQRFIYAKAGDAVKWLLDEDIKQQMVAVVLAGDTAYAAGLPTALDSKDKSELWVLAGADGKKLQTLTLPGRPVYDGLSAAGGRLYLTTEDGRLMCFGAR